LVADEILDREATMVMMSGGHVNAGARIECLFQLQARRARTSADTGGGKLGKA